MVIGPDPAKHVLIRAVGPTLGNFGLAGALADPMLTLFNGANAVVALNDNGSAADATRLQISATSAPIVGIVVSPGSGRRGFLVRVVLPNIGRFAKPNFGVRVGAQSRCALVCE